jgi:hypothetical protein
VEGAIAGEMERAGAAGKGEANETRGRCRGVPVGPYMALLQAEDWACWNGGETIPAEEKGRTGGGGGGGGGPPGKMRCRFGECGGHGGEAGRRSRYCWAVFRGDVEGADCR